MYDTSAFQLFDGKRVTVMGLGRFGGGLGAVKFLARRGARVTVTDLAPQEKLAESLAELADCPIEALHLGGHDERDFEEAELVVVNPAIPRSNRFLQLAVESGVPLTSEMNLFWQLNRGRVVGVTGSNGKSTTTALTHSILQAAGHRCWLGGNIGRSLLPRVEEIEPDDWVVLELSSFQLDDLERLPSSPQVAVVTNFSPNHLDWHESLVEYRRAKQTILRWQSPACVAVLNQDDADVSTWPTNGRRLWFGSDDHGRNGIFPSECGMIFREVGRTVSLDVCRWLKLPGRHNVLNAMAAACAALAIGVDADAVRRGIEEYQPLPHRLQFVGEVQGRRFYNDSLATTPESAIVALESFREPIVLLAGGYDKQVDLSAFAAAIARRAKAVALMGQTAEFFGYVLETNFPQSPVVSQECATFEEAFRWAVGQSAEGDVVLLSPGCASYDWFRNFADRGEQFAAMVGALREKTGQPVRTANERESRE